MLWVREQKAKVPRYLPEVHRVEERRRKKKEAAYFYYRAEAEAENYQIKELIKGKMIKHNKTRK